MQIGLSTLRQDLSQLEDVLAYCETELVAWKEFRRDRGTTSHAYDHRKAMEVFGKIPAFLEEARLLCGEISRRQEETA